MTKENTSANKSSKCTTSANQSSSTTTNSSSTSRTLSTRPQSGKLKRKSNVAGDEAGKTAIRTTKRMVIFQSNGYHKVVVIHMLLWQTVLTLCNILTIGMSFARHRRYWVVSERSYYFTLMWYYSILWVFLLIFIGTYRVDQNTDMLDWYTLTGMGAVVAIVINSIFVLSPVVSTLAQFGHRNGKGLIRLLMEG